MRNQEMLPRAMTIERVSKNKKLAYRKLSTSHSAEKVIPNDTAVFTASCKTTLPLLSILEQNNW